MEKYLETCKAILSNPEDICHKNLVTLMERHKSENEKENLQILREIDEIQMHLRKCTGLHLETSLWLSAKTVHMESQDDIDSYDITSIASGLWLAFDMEQHNIVAMDSIYGGVVTGRRSAKAALKAASNYANGGQASRLQVRTLNCNNASIGLLNQILRTGNTMKPEVRKAVFQKLAAMSQPKT